MILSIINYYLCIYVQFIVTDSHVYELGGGG